MSVYTAEAFTEDPEDFQESVVAGLLSEGLSIVAGPETTEHEHEGRTLIRVSLEVMG